MPNKFNAERRHHIPKMSFKLTNWAAYEAGLRQRGSSTLWVTEQAIDAWRAAQRSTPGGQATYSDSAIQTCLILRTACKLALRRAEGLMMSVVELLGRELAVPDPTTVSRRAIKRALTNTASAHAAAGANCTWPWMRPAARLWPSR